MDQLSEVDDTTKAEYERDAARSRKIYDVALGQDAQAVGLSGAELVASATSLATSASVRVARTFTSYWSSPRQVDRR